jgi:hypothetical protein
MRAEANPHDAGAGRLGIPVDYRDNHKLMKMLHPNVLN